MKANQILHADILDILFEGRNKLYGAYQLRKNYEKRLSKALTIMFMIVLGFSLISLLTRPTVTLVTKIFEEPDVRAPNIHPPEQPKETQAAENSRIRTTSAGKFTFTDSSDITKDTIAFSGDPSFPSDYRGGDIGPSFPLDSTRKPGGPPVTVQPIIIPEPEIIDHPDVMPEFPGGLKALKKFLEKNLREPDAIGSINESQPVSVKIAFVVGYDGKLKEFRIVQDGGKEFNDEVTRVLKKMPDWKPGIAKGKNVSVHYTLPVRFEMP